MSIPALINYFADVSKLKNSFWRNSMTYGTPCQAIGHFVFLLSPCYLQDTMPCQWTSSDFLLWVLRIWESDFNTQAFFTLHSFLLVSRPPWGRQFNLNISSVSCWYFQNIAPAQLFVWIKTIHNKNMLVRSI